MLAIMNNFAFIDLQNTHQGTKTYCWEIDWGKFRKYLAEKYSVSKAYAFIGYIPDNESLYHILRNAGYDLIFKPVIRGENGIPKGNCDADLVLFTIVNKDKYDKAVIVTSDGDFYSLVRYLYENNKLCMVLSSHASTCSRLLKREAKEKINYMFNMRKKLARKVKRCK